MSRCAAMRLPGTRIRQSLGTGRRLYCHSSTQSGVDRTSLLSRWPPGPSLFSPDSARWSFPNPVTTLNIPPDGHGLAMSCMNRGRAPPPSSLPLQFRTMLHPVFSALLFAQEPARKFPWWDSNDRITQCEVPDGASARRHGGGGTLKWERTRISMWDGAIVGG